MEIKIIIFYYFDSHNITNLINIYFNTVLNMDLKKKKLNDNFWNNKKLGVSSSSGYWGVVYGFFVDNTFDM